MLFRSGIKVEGSKPECESKESVDLWEEEKWKNEIIGIFGDGSI